MPRKPEMSWDTSHGRRRWLKEYRGKKYSVSVAQLCEQFGVQLPETKDGSYQQANAWWQAKKAELDAAATPAPRTPKPFEDVVGAMFGPDIFTDNSALMRLLFRSMLANAGLPDEVNDALRRVLDAPIPKDYPFDQPAWDLLREVLRQVAVDDLLQRCVRDGEPLPDTLHENLAPSRLHQFMDGVNGMRGESTAPAERTVLALVDRWVKRQHDQAQAGRITPGRADNNRICLQHFRDFLGTATDIEHCIDAARLDAFYLYCRGKMQERLNDPRRKAGWSADYAKKVFDTARRFIRDLWELKWADVTLPRNIDSKGFRFNVGARAVRTWELEEFKTVLAAAQNWRQLPLHLLLMANCGYRHQDISDLEQCQVDWKRGRIIRARSKIDDQENAPIVNYKLWPRTFELLRHHRNPDHSPHARVLLTASGRPWVWEEMVEGSDGTRKLRSCNSINSNFAHVRKRIGFNKPLAMIRKMGASLLEKKHHRCVQEYLGEAPTSIKDKHYARPDQVVFDEAVSWLGEQLGLA
jgi:integrase